MTSPMANDLRDIADALDEDGLDQIAIKVRAAASEIEQLRKQDEVHWKTRRALLRDLSLRRDTKTGASHE